MTPLAAMPPILELLDRLTGVETAGGPRAAERAMIGDGVQRLFIGGQWRLRDRLELLTHLSGVAATAPLPQRSRDVIAAEITRLALRVLWSAGLLGDAAPAGARGAETAGRLLELAASDMLPEGGAFEVVMKRARDLLGRHDVAAEIAADEALRNRLREQLERARNRYTLVTA